APPSPGWGASAPSWWARWRCPCWPAGPRARPPALRNSARLPPVSARAGSGPRPFRPPPHSLPSRPGLLRSRRSLLPPRRFPPPPFSAPAPLHLRAHPLEHGAAVRTLLQPGSNPRSVFQWRRTGEGVSRCTSSRVGSFRDRDHPVLPLPGFGPGGVRPGGVGSDRRGHPSLQRLHHGGEANQGILVRSARTGDLARLPGRAQRRRRRHTAADAPGWYPCRGVPGGRSPRRLPLLPRIRPASETVVTTSAFDGSALQLPPGTVPLAWVVRSGLIESVHQGHLLATGTDGSDVLALGAPEAEIYARSS